MTAFLNLMYCTVANPVGPARPSRRDFQVGTPTENDPTPQIIARITGVLEVLLLTTLSTVYYKAVFHSTTCSVPSPVYCGAFSKYAYLYVESTPNGCQCSLNNLIQLASWRNGSVLVSGASGSGFESQARRFLYTAIFRRMIACHYIALVTSVVLRVL